MSIRNFIPQLWSARILAALDRALVYGQVGVINRDYEGEISGPGDTLHINSIGDPTIKDYTRNTDIDTPEELDSASAVLTIDQLKYFNFAVDDVDKAQSMPGYFDEAMRRSGFRLRDLVDRFVANLMNSGVTTASTLGTIGAPKTISAATDYYNYLVDLAVLLDEADIPAEGRWLVIPPWFEGGMEKDDRFVRTGTAVGDQVRTNGMIGRAAGFDILKSNNVPLNSTAAGSGGKYSVLGGVSMSTTFAQQIMKMEAFRPERRFSDAVKGLQVYGGKVIRPQGLVKMIVQRP